MRFDLLLLFFSFAALFADDVPIRKGGSLQSLYTSLDPTSVAQHFAFYELYPDTLLGKTALRHAWDLLHGGQNPEMLPSIDLQPIIAFVNRLPDAENAPLLPEEQFKDHRKAGPTSEKPKLERIWNLGNQRTWNRSPAEEIDLARALFLSEMEQDTPDARLKVRSYEAHVDLMALQILARLSEKSTPKEKIRAINDYIFGEMRFRFPPHSL